MDIKLSSDELSLILTALYGHDEGLREVWTHSEINNLVGRLEKLEDQSHEEDSREQVA